MFFWFLNFLLCSSPHQFLFSHWDRRKGDIRSLNNRAWSRVHVCHLGRQRILELFWTKFFFSQLIILTLLFLSFSVCQSTFIGLNPDMRRPFGDSVVVSNTVVLLLCIRWAGFGVTNTSVLSSVSVAFIVVMGSFCLLLLLLLVVASCFWQTVVIGSTGIIRCCRLRLSFAIWIRWSFCTICINWPKYGGMELWKKILKAMYWQIFRLHVNAKNLTHLNVLKLYSKKKLTQIAVLLDRQVFRLLQISLIRWTSFVAMVLGDGASEHRSCSLCTESWIDKCW